jgi:hypothetical protein
VFIIRKNKAGLLRAYPADVAMKFNQARFGGPSPTQYHEGVTDHALCFSFGTTLGKRIFHGLASFQVVRSQHAAAKNLFGPFRQTDGDD